MEQQRHECTDCGTSYTEHKSLLRHLRTPAHAKKAGETALWYFCEESGCSERFARKDGLTRHLKEVHQGLKRNAALRMLSIPDNISPTSAEAATQPEMSIGRRRLGAFDCVFAMARTERTYAALSYHWGSPHGELVDVISPLERIGGLDSLRHFAHFHNLGEHLQSLLKHSARVGIGGATGRSYARLCQHDLVHITIRLLAIAASLFQHDLLKGSHGMVVVSLMRWVKKDIALPDEIIDVLNTRHSPQRNLQTADLPVHLSCLDICVWQSGSSLLATVSSAMQTRAQAILRFCLNVKNVDNIGWDMAFMTGDNAMSLQQLVHDQDCKDYMEYATERLRLMEVQ